MAKKKMERMANPLFEDVYPRECEFTEQPPIYAVITKTGRYDFTPRPLQSGSTYLLNNKYFISEKYASFDYTIDPVEISRIREELRNSPPIVFTKVNSGFEIVRGKDMMEASTRIGENDSAGIYIPLDELQTEKAEI